MTYRRLSKAALGSLAVHVACAALAVLAWLRLDDALFFPLLNAGDTAVEVSFVGLSPEALAEPASPVAAPPAPPPPSEPPPVAPPPPEPAPPPPPVVAPEPMPPVPPPPSSSEPPPAVSLPPEPAGPEPKPPVSAAPFQPAPPSPSGAPRVEAPPPAAPVSAATSNAAAGGRPGVLSPTAVETDARPVYPMSARVRGEEGVVQVLVTLREDGRVREAVVDGSSGFPSLDDAALRALRRARFRAKGARIEEGSQVLLTVRFQLTEPASR